MVYIDIKESDIKVEYKGYEIYFSSKFYKKKFTKEINEYVEQEKLKAKLRNKCEIEGEGIFILKKYKDIEKRGFRVYKEGKEVEEGYKAQIKII